MLDHSLPASMSCVEERVLLRPQTPIARVGRQMGPQPLASHYTAYSRAWRGTQALREG